MGKIGYQQIVNSAIHYIEDNALHSDRVNWKLVKASQSPREGTPPSEEDAYTYIRSLLKELGDEHSHLITKDLAEARYFSISKRPQSSVINSNSGAIGYLKVPGFIETSSLSEVEFIDSIRQNLLDLEKSDLVGWIVDLRDNDGGNMWPMLAGLEGLLDGPCVGHFSSSKNSKETWIVENGRAKIGSVVVSESANLRDLKLGHELPLAFFTSRKTCSSGEAIVVALKGRRLTKQFGSKTAGLSTANEGFELPCGTMLWLTTSIFTDRNGVQYGESIHPDVPIKSTLPDQAIFEAAIKWICPPT